jgi:anti-anti-sigma factor
VTEVEGGLLSTRSHRVDAIPVLVVDGEVDLLTAPLLESALAAVLATADGDVVVDLSAVAFLSARGLAVLVDAVELAAGRGQRLLLVRPDDGAPSTAPRVLALYRLTAHPSVAAALRR